MPDGIYELSEREEAKIRRAYLKRIKAGIYRCIIPECEWKPDKKTTWQDMGEHIFNEHLRCPYCWAILFSFTEFGSHVAECEKQRAKQKQLELEVPF